MRWLSSCSAALLALVLLLVACDTVPDGDCWVNTSGGLGASGTIPIGAGVGAGGGSGDQRHAEKPNPCVTQGSDTADMPAQSSPQPACATVNGEEYVSCMGAVIAYFKSSNFSFVTTVADDGEGVAGGYQESTAVLPFVDGDSTFYICKVRVGMPLRTQFMGKNSASAAATYSANVANLAANDLWPTADPQVTFCANFKNQMTYYFGKNYPLLGAGMMAP
jgi:hypothetical protein